MRARAKRQEECGGRDRAQRDRNLHTTKNRDTVHNVMFGLEVAAIRFVYERPLVCLPFRCCSYGADVVLSPIAPGPQLRQVTSEVVN
jgi:hypothetical protein